MKCKISTFGWWHLKTAQGQGKKTHEHLTKVHSTYPQPIWSLLEPVKVVLSHYKYHTSLPNMSFSSFLLQKPYEFGTPFFSLNVLRFSKYFPWSKWIYLTLFSQNFILIHQELGCKRLKIKFIFGEKMVFNRFFQMMGT